MTDNEEAYDFFRERLARMASIKWPSHYNCAALYSMMNGKSAEFAAAIMFTAALQLIEHQRNELLVLKGADKCVKLHT